MFGVPKSIPIPIFTQIGSGDFQLSRLYIHIQRRITTTESRRNSDCCKILKNEWNNQEEDVDKPESRKPLARDEQKRTDPENVVQGKDILPKAGQYESCSDADLQTKVIEYLQYNLYYS